MIISLENNLNHPDFGEQLNELHRHLTSAIGDKFYMLCLLRHLDESHRFFKKSYKSKEKVKMNVTQLDKKKKEVLKNNKAISRCA